MRPSEGGTDERRFRVRFEAVSDGFEGRLTVVATDQEGAERRISAKTCAEALDAPSLIAALAIDPTSDRTRSRGRSRSITSNHRADCDWWFGTGYTATFENDCTRVTLDRTWDNCGNRYYFYETTVLEKRP